MLLFCTESQASESGQPSRSLQTEEKITSGIRILREHSSE